VKLSKRSVIIVFLALSAALVAFADQTKAPAAKAALKKVENTDPAQRLKWYDQHQAMKAQTPFKDMKWRFIGPDIIGGRCVDIAVPKNSRNIMYIASAVGGLWKTENTGITWQCLTDELPTMSSGDIDIAESDPNIIYYGTGEANIFRSSMAGTGVYKSVDAGKTWTHVGLAGTYTIGRIRIHPTNPDVVYVAASGHEWTTSPDRGVYKTADGGKTWQKILYLNEKVGAIDLVMDPKNPDVLIASMCHRIRLRWSDPVPEPGDGLFKTVDGGKSFRSINYEGLHGDHHGIWIDPNDSNYVINVNDGGANVSYDGGLNWRDFHKGIPSVQFYNVMYDMNKPFIVYGSVQDQGTLRGIGVGPAPAQTTGRRFRGQGVRWETAPGGEGTIIAVDPTNPNLEYASSFYGRLMRSEYKNGQWTSKEIYPKPAAGEPEHRGQWLAATILSPHDPNILYHGFQYVFRSKDKGETWDKISPDLTYNDPQKQGKLPYAINYATITAIDESPLKAGVLYAGTDDGRVHVTLDGGAKWTEVTAGLPYNKHVWCITASKYDPATVYISLVGRHDDDFNPYLFKSVDYGKTWTSIAANIPGGSTNVIREDTKKAGVLYCGTDIGAYVTTDGAKTWSVLGSGLPNVAVWDLQIHPRDNVIVIATNGRGMWVIDNAAPAQK